ncbi:MAG: hypothetical protein GX458_20270 [Phyllobacteriaceae bacterium]|nr:hypothetical protein [Phyllobacteriaceae bacterium]
MGPAVRVLLGGFGLFTFLAPWELLVRPGHPFELAELPFWLVSLGALAVGLPMLAGEILGLAREIVVDFDRRLVVETTRGDFGLRFCRALRFADVVAVEMVENDWSDGPSTWEVVARIAGARRAWSIHTFSGRQAAEALRDDLATRIAAG